MRISYSLLIISVELDCLGPLLSEIVVALTPFIDNFPEIVSEILQYLIVENRCVRKYCIVLLDCGLLSLM